ncbi:hypothetical protein ACWCPQ_09070 [Nocardia sp. NPDC001965]
MSKVTLSTELPIPARDACPPAQLPELFAYVVAPLLRGFFPTRSNRAPPARHGGGGSA